MFCIAAGTVVYAIFGQLLVIFLQDCSNNTTGGIRNIARSPSSLHSFKSFKEIFSPILFINCVNIFIEFIFNSYAFLNEMGNPQLLAVAVWDGILSTEAFIRLWLICNTADTIQQSVRTWQINHN
jgi:hypothetical protein